jgi:hypothetical protein
MAVTLAKHVPSGTVPGTSAPAVDWDTFAALSAGSARAGAVHELVWTDMAVNAAATATTAPVADATRSRLLSICVLPLAECCR